MKPETLAALQGSIKKWEGVVNGTIQDLGCNNCALCIRFSSGVCQTGEEPEEVDDAETCPVKLHTGLESCAGTPYVQWAHQVIPYGGREAHNEEDKNLAQAEVDFLKSLLPEGENT